MAAPVYLLSPDEEYADISATCTRYMSGPFGKTSFAQEIHALFIRLNTVCMHVIKERNEEKKEKDRIYELLLEKSATHDSLFNDEMMKAGLEMSNMMKLMERQRGDAMHSFDPKHPLNAKAIEEMLQWPKFLKLSHSALFDEISKREAKIWELNEKHTRIPDKILPLQQETCALKVFVAKKTIDADAKTRESIKRAEFERNQKQARLAFQQTLLENKVQAVKKARAEDTLLMGIDNLRLENG
jgi:hypothetical protein